MVPVSKLDQSDIAKMAIGMEDRGRKFYTAAAEAAENTAIKDVFLRLAEEEKEHKATFEKLFARATAEKMFDQETVTYVKALLSSNVFPEEHEKTLANVSNSKEALAMGIQAEKDAILFYHELLDHAVDEETKDILNRLLKAEKIHLVELRNELDEL